MKIIGQDSLDNRIKAKGYEDTVMAKLCKRIHLPDDLRAATHEERHLVSRYIGENSIEVNPLNNWKRNYGRFNGWTVIHLQPVLCILQARTVEVILRRHKLGNVILFRVWKELP